MTGSTVRRPRLPGLTLLPAAFRGPAPALTTPARGPARSRARGSTGPGITHTPKYVRFYLARRAVRGDGPVPGMAREQGTVRRRPATEGWRHVYLNGLAPAGRPGPGHAGRPQPGAARHRLRGSDAVREGAQAGRHGQRPDGSLPGTSGAPVPGHRPRAAGLCPAAGAEGGAGVRVWSARPAARWCRSLPVPRTRWPGQKPAAGRRQARLPSCRLRSRHFLPLLAVPLPGGPARWPG
jgi:hypothetical protein